MKPKRAVILVPGVGGSTLHARHRQTGVIEEVWARPSLEADNIMRNAMFCRYNNVTGWVRSSVEYMIEALLIFLVVLHLNKIEI